MRNPNLSKEKADFDLLNVWEQGGWQLQALYCYESSITDGFGEQLRHIRFPNAYYRNKTNWPSGPYMTGETNLDKLIQSLSAVLVEGLYVFATVQPNHQSLDIVPRMTFSEAEGTTYILLKSEAETLELNY